MSTHILVVEDNELMRDLIAKALRRAGYQVVTASNGDEGLARFRESVPDLVITDFIMPEHDGLDMTATIHSLRPDTKILLMSGYGGTGRIGFTEMVRRLGADKILQKPFAISHLIATVRSCIGAAEQRRTA